MKRRFSRWWKYGYLFALLLAVLAAGCGGGDWSSGDRVLVSKFSYDLGIDRPRRYDVVVFRFPDRPIENGTPKNYIKRLLGLPGELLAIFFGNIYRYNPEKHGPVEHVLPNVDPKNLWRSEKTAVTVNDIHQFGMIENDKKDRDFFLDGKFEILRKSPVTLLAMRRIVFDNDFPPKDLANDPRFTRWQPEKNSGWTGDAKDKHGFTHSAQGKEIDWLRYRHIPRPSPEIKPEDLGKPQLITDFLGYNAYATIDRPPAPYRPYKHNWVGDLLLDCEVTVEKTEGEFWMELSKGPDRFRACWDLATGECTLYRVGDGGKKQSPMSSAKTRLKGPGTYEVRFANVDDRLTVWVGRDLPFDAGVIYQAEISKATLSKQGPTKNDLEPASLGSKGAAVTVRHLKLWRDVYYTREVASTADATNVGEVNWSDPTTWRPLRELDFRTFYVQPGHYFCLGDNSAASSDSRDWGLVPERLMLGRALMVYFPFNRAGAIE